MDDLLSEFLTETSESLDVVDVELVRFESCPDDKATLNNIFRLVHTIKGTCGFIGLPRLESLAHAGETLLGKFRDGALDVTPEAVTLILASIDRIKSILAHLGDTQAEPAGDDRDLIAQLEDAAEGGLQSSSRRPSPQQRQSRAMKTAAGMPIKAATSVPEKSRLPISRPLSAQRMAPKSVKPSPPPPLLNTTKTARPAPAPAPFASMWTSSSP